jgi:hypothetical protein
VNELKSIGHVGEEVLRDNGGIVFEDRIIVDDGENFTGLSQYSHCVIVHSDIHEQLLRQVVGPDISPSPAATKVRLVSVVGNVVTVEKFVGIIDEKPGLRNQANVRIFGIEPWYPEYDLQEGDENPEWVDYVLKKYGYVSRGAALRCG